MSDIPRANRELGELIAYAEMPARVSETLTGKRGKRFAIEGYRP